MDGLIAPIAPRRLKIELTQTCNLACDFCYHGADKRGASVNLPESAACDWIDWAVSNGIPDLLFTGGEATLHPQIRGILNYAHLRGRRVLLCTNGLAEEPLYRELFRVTGQVALSLPSLDAERLDAMTGRAHVLDRKLAALRLAREVGVPQIHILTTLMPELHGRLGEFARFAEEHAPCAWLPLRALPTPENPRPWSRADAQAFAEEMSGLMDRHPRTLSGIYLAMPFCAISPMSLGARVFPGRVACCGPFFSLAVDEQGSLQVCYDAEALGHPRDLDAVREDPTVRASAELARLPEECRRCELVSRCAGGCRKTVGLATYGDRQVDYLAGFIRE